MCITRDLQCLPTPSRLVFSNQARLYKTLVLFTSYHELTPTPYITKYHVSGNTALNNGERKPLAVGYIGVPRNPR
jgi:hypothetical protein